MKKQLLVMVFAVIGAISAQASYLLWQVNSSDSTGLWLDPNAFNLVQVNGDAKTVIDTAFDNKVNQVTLDASCSGYSYYIEMLAYTSATEYTTVAIGETFAYSQLSLVTDLSSVPVSSVFHGGSFQAVPEPTGGMLVLVGMALMALKRKTESV